MCYSIDFKQQSVKLYYKFKNMKVVAELMNISVNTIWHWVRFGISRKTRLYSPSICSIELVTFIKQYLTKFPFKLQKDVQQVVFKKFSIKISRQCVANAIFKANFSRKRLSKRGFVKKRLQKQRVIAFKKAYASVKHVHSIVSVDEVGFDQRTVPIYGYSQKGCKAISNGLTNKRIRTTMITAIDENNNIFYKLCEGGTKGIQFAEFIRCLPWPHSSTIIMDNASIHKTHEVKRAFNSKGFNVLHSPPYTPECNPIENVFSYIKNCFRKMTVSKYYKTKPVSQIIPKIIKSIDKTLFYNAFKNTERYISY